MDEKLKEAIKAAVLADQIPAILRLIEATCQAEGKRLMTAWMESDERKREEEEERKHPERWDSFDGKRKTPRWMWWTFLGDRFDWWIRGVEKDIEERDLTNAEKDKRRRDAEIKQKREELERLTASPR